MEKTAPDHHRDLHADEAVAKLKSLIESARVCMFQTVPNHPPFHIRPMSPADVDDDGNIWFFSSRASEKNHDIETNPNVQLIFSNMPDNEFLSVYGAATIITDRLKFEELWKPVAKAWFPKGPEDPDLTLIRVIPLDAHYWDSKNGKMVTMLKIAASAITGSSRDGAVEGDLII